ncbi:hypothetical protein [Streptomyces sp. NPDC003863]
MAAVLDALPAESLIEGVWQDKDGRIHSAIADEEEFTEWCAGSGQAHVGRGAAPVTKAA